MNGNWLNMGIAAALFFAGRGLLGYMAKADAQMSDVFRRSVQYRREYPASSTAAYKNLSKARRWC
jgi:type IV secretory pathway TrbD component